VKPEKIIDIHCHVYPDKIAAKAVASVGQFYNIPMQGAGSVPALLQCQLEAGIETSVIHSVALRPENVVSINDFIAEQARLHPSLIGFATMHPEFDDMAAEVERCLSLGLKGFKLHPDSQAVNVDDPRLMQLYSLIEGRVPLIVHAGDYRYDYSHPRRIRNLLQAFPLLVVNAAHFGGWSVPDLAREYLEQERCYMDISSSMEYIGLRRAKELIEIYGPERMLFGSDFPMWTPAGELERFLQIDLPREWQEMILWRNAERFLKSQF
jgi:predicted TIM-barrel fold metal-dependent hydrolase